MARPSKVRRVCRMPAHTHFYAGAPNASEGLHGLQLSIEEYEVIRLLDYQGLTQQEAAKQMGAGRTTVQALYTQARRKLARFLVEGFPLTIAGGSYQLCPGQGCQGYADFRKKGGHVMKIAVTYEDGQVFQHFGHTSQFKVYEVEHGTISSSEIVDTNGQGHGALAGFLLKGGVDVLICGGIGGGARNALAEAGIELYPGATGDADAQVESFLKGQLVYDPDTTCSHHSHEDGHGCGGHSHGDGHTCGSHGCGGN
ncbi:hypothetical protein C810_02034 [Lachnospiraceae bacterium A2]|nr:hypothetical protein C810_02034 [Lachnospiraceae bacterium A2]